MYVVLSPLGLGNLPPCSWRGALAVIFKIFYQICFFPSRSMLDPEYQENLLINEILSSIETNKHIGTLTPLITMAAKVTSRGHIVIVVKKKTCHVSVILSWFSGSYCDS